MSVDGASVTPGAAEQRTLEAETGNEELRFVSRRSLRELIGADARHGTDAEGFVHVASSLLRVVLESLQAPAGLLLSPVDYRCIASEGFTDEERNLLGAGEGGFGGLARRSLEEQRAFLFGRTSREPLIASLREVRPDRMSVALVPLFDRDRACGALVLASPSETGLSPAMIRALAPEFRLLALLLHPGRFAPSSAAAEDGTGSAETERYLVEIEDLRGSLGEARQLLRQLEEQASSNAAARRAEVEEWRARLAELEAGALASSQAATRREELEAECERRGAVLAERDHRIRTLEAEVWSLTQRLEAAEATAQALTESSSSEGSDSLEPASIEVSDIEDVQLGEIARAAAEAIDELEGGADLEQAPELEQVETLVPGEDLEDIRVEGIEAASERVLEEAHDKGLNGVEVPEVAEIESSGGEAEVSHALWHVDLDDRARTWMSDLARASGAVLWAGDGDPPRAGRSILALNLFDAALEQSIELAERSWGKVESIVYAADAESGMGLELGRIGWLRRPLDAAEALTRIRYEAGRRLTGILIVSTHLRELATLRQALTEADAAGSVACDARQAADVLEIVRRPDAVLIDLLLEGAQGLAIAKQLRKNRETMDVPIIFLLPERIDPVTLRSEAERAKVLEPYGADDARRMVNGALARHL